MVAQFNSETFAPTSHTPEPTSSDPDEVRLALETARAFQTMGEIGDAVEWLERAAERAAQAGQHERAVVLLQAIAQLTIRSARSPRLASAPSALRSEVQDRGSVRPPPAKLPPFPPPLDPGVSSSPPPARTSSLLPPPPRKSLPPLAGKASLPPVPMLSLLPPRDVSSPKGPPRASVPPKRSSRVAPASAARASSSANTIRVAIAGLVSEFGSFKIERLAKGQPLPAGTKEATLTLSDDERTIEVVMRSLDCA